MLSLIEAFQEVNYLLAERLVAGPRRRMTGSSSFLELDMVGAAVPAEPQQRSAGLAASGPSMSRSNSQSSTNRP